MDVRTSVDVRPSRVPTPQHVVKTPQPVSSPKGQFCAAQCKGEGARAEERAKSRKRGPLPSFYKALCVDRSPAQGRRPTAAALVQQRLNKPRSRHSTEKKVQRLKVEKQSV